MKIINNALLKYRQKAQANKEKSVRIEAEQLFQICEFNRKIFVCYRGIPLIESTGIEQLEKMRSTYTEYILKSKK